MINITNNSTNPHFNLALEEYALKHLDLDDDVVILWQNKPSVIIGRNQNTIEEINSKFIVDNNIDVVRRLSGGGAVYHDLGNLNFTFITKNKDDSVSNFKKFTEPVVKALRSLDVNAEFSGRNDITIDGKKFSGNAQYYFSGKLLHHGTILFDSDLRIVQEALNVKIEKIESKGIKSIRSRVTNILPYLKEKISVHEFKDFLLAFILQGKDSKRNEYKLTDQDLEKIDEMMHARYSSWDWNYGESPDYHLQKSKRFEAGTLDIRLNIQKGLIEECRIYGDFFGSNDINDLAQLLKNQMYDEQNIRRVLEKTPFHEYIFKISIDDFIDCMFY
ncbi:lipoate--protein ligase [Alkaliphilus hydrothermalis]|uniref:lipoate--protein ligase n=1 Tax=Alkaliphilus hydrothermalis TaxID=1482730 RepID=A0ABS2NKR6_9FIRM|nr:lipoate--protein ligase [Alkaliphilus hydrothermalis]MBM7613493.1 lipoate-protein ligase A [Alkaliphilus hydrothermalis]